MSARGVGRWYSGLAFRALLRGLVARLAPLLFWFGGLLGR
jgi:hypothetical protein